MAALATSAAGCGMVDAGVAAWWRRRRWAYLLAALSLDLADYLCGFVGRQAHRAR